METDCRFWIVRERGRFMETGEIEEREEKRKLEE